MELHFLKSHVLKLVDYVYPARASPLGHIVGQVLKVKPKLTNYWPKLTAEMR